MSTAADKVSSNVQENTRTNAAQIAAVVVQRLSEVTRARAAACIGVHGSTVSRMATEHLDDLALLLAALDLKVVSADSIVCTQEELRFYKLGAFKFLQADLEKDRMREKDKVST